MRTQTIKIIFIYLSAIIGLVFLVGCSCSGGVNRTDFELFHDMMNQPSIKAQEGGKDGELLMYKPVKNTRARNQSYYLYKGDPISAGQNLKNPLDNQFSAQVISLGKRQYEKTCIVCHGAKGDGQSLVSDKMAVKPPSLLTQKVWDYSDGRIYHIIHEGQGLMSGYKKQVFREKDRWALVNYIRMLQKEDLKKKIENAKNVKEKNVKEK